MPPPIYSEVCTKLHMLYSELWLTHHPYTCYVDNILFTTTYVLHVVYILAMAVNLLIHQISYMCMHTAAAWCCGDKRSIVFDKRQGTAVEGGVSIRGL